MPARGMFSRAGLFFNLLQTPTLISCVEEIQPFVPIGVLPPQQPKFLAASEARQYSLKYVKKYQFRTGLSLTAYSRSIEDLRYYIITGYLHFLLERC
jgi:hypothetical protein